MWQGILIVLSTLVGLVLIGFCFKYRRTGLGYASGLWAILAMAAGVASAVLAVAATVDHFKGWLIPSTAFLVVFIQLARATRNALNARIDGHIQAQADLQSSLGLFDREPRVVDYSEFAFAGEPDLLLHARRDGGKCEIWVDSLVTPLTELIALADNHVCTFDDATIVMKAVA